jgi:nucleotide-binding universal stress UspA family protein
MSQWKKVLCPVDFSEVSMGALHYAADLCKESGAHLMAIHVIEPIVDPGDFTFRPVTIVDLERQLAERAQESLAKAVTALGLPEGKVSTAVEHGVASAEIVRTAAEEGVDLIVMGTHGLTGIAHALIGSTAERVVRKATCPVLTMKVPQQG